MKIKGLLISENNDEITKEDLQNVEFILLRAGYTSYSVSKKKYIDSKFYSNFNLLKEFDIPFGIYYESCAVTNEQSIDEANCFLSILNEEYKDYPLYMFVNDNHNTVIYSNVNQENLTKEDLTKIVLTFLNILEDNDYDVGIISSINWFKNKLYFERLKDFECIIIKKDEKYVYAYDNYEKEDKKVKVVLEKNCLLDKIIYFFRKSLKIIKGYFLNH